MKTKAEFQADVQADVQADMQFKQERIVPMRVQKFLARAGVASRRGSENLMTAGRVKLNGKLVTELGTKIDPLVDTLTVDDKEVRLQDQAVYIMLNKPAGYLTTMSDPQKRATVAELVDTTNYPGLFPVGRLDRDTTGILLFMTDGELAQNLLHPKKHVSKCYQASVEGLVKDKDLEPLRKGITLDDGPCAPAQVRIISNEELEHSVQRSLRKPIKSKSGQRSLSHVEIILKEGRKRQVKRMLSAIGHPVVALHRSSFAGLKLEGLREGSYRHLSSAELELLRKQVG